MQTPFRSIGCERADGSHKQSYNDSQKILEPAHGPATVRDGILVIGAHLGEAFTGLVGYEYRVVSESAIAMRLSCYPTFHTTLETVFLTGAYQRDCRSKMRTAVFLPFELVEKLGHIVGRRTVLTSITGTVNARCSVESIDHQAGVIGKAVISISFLHPTRFYKSVSFKCVGSLGYVIMTSYLGKRHNLKPVGNYLTGLLKFMGVIGCKNKFLDFIHLMRELRHIKSYN